MIQEGKLITNNSICCALDAADTASRAVNTSVLLRRHAWLCISGFKPEVQQTILNQPLDQEHLFGPSVDTSLEKMKDTDTAKSMGALQTQTSRGSFRRSSYRGTAKTFQSEATASTYKSPTHTTPSRAYYRGNNTKGRGSNTPTPSTSKQ